VGGAFLHIFVERIDGGEIGPFPFGGSDRCQRPAGPVERLPILLLISDCAALRILNDSAVRIAVEPFAIDAHRRRRDDAAYRVSDQPLKQDRRANVIDGRIPLDLIH
jgi:hypothetical protein